ncbi:MAG: sulfotransferase [Solirubrobacterales bacterium]
MNADAQRASGPIVLFVAGSFRSGSTVLDNLLGQVDGFTSVGELRSLWRNGLIEGRICGCGEHVRECPFWTGVLDAAYGAHPPDPRAVVALQDRHLRTRPRQLVGLRRAAGGADSGGLSRYLSLVEPLYRAIAEVDGARVVVDSSKVPADAYALVTLSDLDVRVLHLVRDPRAVAYSSARAKPSPDDPNSDTMTVSSPLRTSVAWSVWNGVLERMVAPAAGQRYMRLRYEDFAADPRRAAREICDFAGMPDAELPFVGERTVRFQPTHGPSGNPDRLDRGESEIVLNERWRTGMSRPAQLAAALPALPLMAGYGYRPGDRGAG